METTAASAIPQHPIRLIVSDDLQRNRLTVFFRLILAIPHFIWVTLWGVIAILAYIVNWFATLFMGRSPEGLHNFLVTFLRYSTHVRAYTLLVADPFPAFTGRPGSYPIDVEIDGPERQNRLTVFFRWILAILALLLGRVPEGLRNFAALAIRIETQTYGYLMLLTGRYPSFNVGVSA